MSLPTPSPRGTAVVTGASSGIGRELVLNLAGRGHHVTLVARSTDKLTALGAEISAAGGQAEVLAADLTDRAARASLLDRVTAADRVPDLLVNNAGLSTLGAVAAAEPDAEMTMLEVDVVAVADLCCRFLPGMVARKSGAVLNVASTGAFQPLPGQAGYGASKSFVLSYTESLRGELIGTNVTATVLCPGPVDTGFGERAGFSKEEAEAALPRFMWKSPAFVAEAGIKGLDRGKAVVIPGFGNRLAAGLGRLAPHRVLVPILARSHPGLRN